MKGNLTRRGKSSWRIKFDAGRDPNTGERKIIYKTVRGTKRAAEAELNRLLVSFRDGAWVEPSRMLVSEYLDRWLKDHASVRVSAKTFERYGEFVTNHLSPRLGSQTLQKLSPLNIQSAYADMLANGRLDGNGGLSAQTVHHAHRILFQALRQAVRWQLLTRNSAEAVTPPRATSPEIKILDDVQLGTLINAARSTRLYAPILLAATTGLRRGEIFGLRWRDLELNRSRLSVSQAIEETKEAGLAFKEPKTKRSRRVVTLPPVTIESLNALRASQAAERLALGIGKDGRDLVFTNALGDPVSPRGASKEFKRILGRAGLAHGSFHILRHTHITNLLRDGVHPKIASERAGHASVAITLDRYSHAIPSMQEDLTTGIEASIRTAIEQTKDGSEQSW